MVTDILSTCFKLSSGLLSVFLYMVTDIVKMLFDIRAVVWASPNYLFIVVAEMVDSAVFNVLLFNLVEQKICHVEFCWLNICTSTFQIIAPRIWIHKELMYFALNQKVSCYGERIFMIL